MTGQVVRIDEIVGGAHLHGAESDPGRTIDKIKLSRADLAVARPPPSTLVNSRARYGMVVLR